ncbi:MAG: hypothetical protein OEZ04_09660 [Nitrospinota bacterium]|nr:hypothetical protein [Nitrospinota bacterium]
MVGYFRCVLISVALFTIGVLVGITSTKAYQIYYQRGAVIAEGLSRQGLYELRPGMTTEEVVSLVGPPLCVKVADASTLQPAKSSLAGLNASNINESSMWIYARPSKLSFGGIEMNVYFDKGKLSSAYIENYDLGVYKCDASECPKIWNAKEFNNLDSLKEFAFHKF